MQLQFTGYAVQRRIDATRALVVGASGFHEAFARERGGEDALGVSVQVGGLSRQLRNRGIEDGKCLGGAAHLLQQFGSSQESH